MTPAEHWFPGRIRQLTRSECLELLREHHVGRLAFCDDRGPVVLPMNYTLDGNDILVATSPHTEVARHLTSAPAAFQIDAYDDYTVSGWSVLVRGRTEAVCRADLPDPMDRPHPWVEGPRQFHIRITGEEFTGRRLLGA